MDERKLVWTAPGTAGFLDALPREAAERLEIAEIPADPLGDPRLKELRALIPPAVRNQADDRYELKTLIARAPALELLQTLTAGVDWIVGQLPGTVTLCSVRGAYDDLMAELLMAGILAVYKEIPHYAHAQAEQRWTPLQLRVLGGSTVLLVGYGSIAQCLEGYLKPFGVKVLRVARTARDGVHDLGDLPALLPEADVVVVLTPLTGQTRGLVDAPFLARMKPGALLVNGARGRVADTAALIDAAGRGHVRAFLDVTDPEPLPDGHPLWSTPGVFITPHVGSLVPGNQELAFAVVRANLSRWALGEPLLNVVEDGY